MRKVKSCGVLVLSADERSFLLMRHRNRWDLPKGHIEPDESELDCALRELREETGISADQIELIEPAEDIPLDDAVEFDCHRTAVRPPMETKEGGQAPSLTLLPEDDCCGPGQCC